MLKKATLALVTAFALCASAATIFDEPVKLRVQSNLKELNGITAHVVTTDAPMVVVYVAKSTSQDRTAEVINFWGEKVAHNVVPGAATWFQFIRPEIGAYTINLYDGGNLIATTNFSVVPPVSALPEKRSPFGMCSHFAHLTYPTGIAQIMRAAGCSEIREETFWSAVEKVKGKLSLEQPSLKRISYAQTKLRLITVLDYGNPHYDKYSAPHTPEGIAAWQKYVEFCVKSYPQCTDWEIWNEFNCAFLLRGVVDPTPENYFKLVKITSEAIRKANPQARVVGCATSLLPWQWLEKFFQLGGLQYLDVVSVHPYRWGDWTRPPETLYPDMNRLRQLINKYSKGRKIAIYADEFGYQNSVAETGISPEMQAAYLPRSYANIMRAGVERGYWYVFMKHAKERANWHIGIYTKKNNFTPDPAYSAYSALTHTLKDYDYVGQKEPLIDQAWVMHFKKGNSNVCQVWAGDKPVALEVKTTEPVEVIDLMGAVRKLAPVNGKIDLLLRNTTVYIRGKVTGVIRNTDLDISSRREACIGSPLHVNLKMPANTWLNIRGWKVTSGAVELPGASKAGGNAVKGTILRNGKISGYLYFQYEVASQLDVEAMQLDKAGKARVMLTNRNPGKALKVTGISGLIDKKPFTLAAKDLPKFSGKSANETLSIALPLKDFKPYNIYQVKLKIDFDKHSPVEDEETIGYNPCYKVNHIKWDTKLDDWEKVPSINLNQAKQLRDMLGIHVCANYSKNTGRMWVAWNEKFLYYAAEINDAKFHQVFPLWEGDSLQIGIAPLKVDPLTTIELQAGWRPSNNTSLLIPSRVPVGFDGTAITRWSHTRFTHKNGKTIYEMAIPWKVLPFVKPAVGSFFRSTIIVNDNNGGARRHAVLCWGDGITNTKTSKRYPVWTFEGELK